MQVQGNLKKKHQFVVAHLAAILPTSRKWVQKNNPVQEA